MKIIKQVYGTSTSTKAENFSFNLDWIVALWPHREILPCPARMAQMVAIPESAMAGQTNTWQGLVDIGSPVFAGDARRRPPFGINTCELQKQGGTKTGA